jgi:hypothetical protein
MMPGGAPSDSCVTFYPIAQLQELLGSHGNVLATEKAPIRISVGRHARMPYCHALRRGLRGGALVMREHHHLVRAAAASLLMAAIELPDLRTMPSSSLLDSFKRRRTIRTWTRSFKSSTFLK